MKEFVHFYNWGLAVKLYMGLYTIAMLFAKGVVVLLQGGDAINVWVILEMTLTAFAASIVQYACFPPNRDLERPALLRRTALWAAAFNALFIGMALAFGWFSGVPAWGALILIAVLEVSLFAVWMGVHVTKKLETDALNGGLERYQREN